MLPLAALSITFTITTLLLLFSVPLDMQEAISTKTLHYIKYYLLDWAADELMTESVKSELNTDNIASTLDLSHLHSSIALFSTEAATSDFSFLKSRSLSIVQIQLMCILVSLSLVIIYFAALPFYQYVSACPPAFGFDYDKGYRHPLQKSVSHTADILSIIFRMKKMSVWKMTLLNDLSTRPKSKKVPLTDSFGNVIKRSSPSLKYSASSSLRTGSVPIQKSTNLVIMKHKPANRVCSMTQMDSNLQFLPQPNLPQVSHLVSNQGNLDPALFSTPTLRTQIQQQQFSIQSSYLFM